MDIKHLLQDFPVPYSLYFSVIIVQVVRNSPSLFHLNDRVLQTRSDVLKFQMSSRDVQNSQTARYHIRDDSNLWFDFDRTTLGTPGYTMPC
jgi:hypothetical protein